MSLITLMPLAISCDMLVIKKTMKNNSSKLALRASDFKNIGRAPLYLVLQKKIQHLIESAQLKTRERLPSELDMVALTGLSVNTIKKALSELERGGYISRHQGQGTFVTATESFFGLHRYFGMQETFFSPLERHLKKDIEITRIVPDEETRVCLRLLENKEVFMVERVLIIKSQRIYTISYLPVELFEDFNLTPLDDLYIRPLYELLSSKFNMPCRLSEELISVFTVDEYIAAKLHVDVGYPVLFSEIIAYTYKNVPFEKRVSYIDTHTLKLRRRF